MPTEIQLETFIRAPAHRCFDLSRSIDLHRASFAHTREKAVGGRTSGLIETGETVTWEAVHFGVRQKLTVRITEMRAPVYFCDEMTKGAFQMMRHEHFFEPRAGDTLMSDKFSYDVPFLIFGRIFNRLILRDYMERLLRKRNETIKRAAESDAWREILNN